MRRSVAGQRWLWSRRARWRVASTTMAVVITQHARRPLSRKVVRRMPRWPPRPARRRRGGRADQAAAQASSFQKAFLDF